MIRMENERNSSFELNPFKTIKSRMVNPILMNVIEAFLTIGFRSPYCQYEVVDSYSFNETRGEGRGSVKPLRSSGTP